MALTIGATVVLADYDFEGDASGTYGDLTPWAEWQGTLHTGATPYFDGYWGGNVNNWIYGAATYDSETGIYTVSGGQYDQWTHNGETQGYWEGEFHPTYPDTADGTWWTTGHGYAGYWWGNLAD